MQLYNLLFDKAHMKKNLVINFVPSFFLTVCLFNFLYSIREGFTVRKKNGHLVHKLVTKVVAVVQVEYRNVEYIEKIYKI